MKSITLPQASELTSPNPLTLVCTLKEDGTTNLATVSWWTYLSYNPGMIAFAMAKTAFSGERVRETKQVILTIPGRELAQAALQCGSSTGHRTNKAEEFSIALEAVGTSMIQIPAHSKAAIQCNLKDYVEVGDHYLYICNVDHVYGDPDEEALFAWNGYAKIAPAKPGE